MSTATTTHPSRDLAQDGDREVRRSLLLDTAASTAVGVLLVAAHQGLAEPLGISTGWLVGLGAFMVVYGLDVGLIATRQMPGATTWRRAARAIPPLNAAWVVASIAVVVAGSFDLTLLGTAFVLGQAAVVAGLAVLQQRALAARAA